MDASVRRHHSATTRSVDTDVKPKRLILSHKGFDSRSGGCPSPIFPDGTMFSLPIPSGDHEQFALHSGPVKSFPNCSGEACLATTGMR